MRPVVVLGLTLLSACWERQRYQERTCLDPPADVLACPAPADVAASLQDREPCGEDIAFVSGPAVLDAGSDTCCYLVTRDRSLLPFCE